MAFWFCIPHSPPATATPNDWSVVVLGLFFQTNHHRKFSQTKQVHVIIWQPQ